MFTVAQSPNLLFWRQRINIGGGGEHGSLKNEAIKHSCVMVDNWISVLKSPIFIDNRYMLHRCSTFFWSVFLLQQFFVLWRHFDQVLSLFAGVNGGRLVLSVCVWSKIAAYNFKIAVFIRNWLKKRFLMGGKKRVFRIIRFVKTELREYYCGGHDFGGHLQFV